MWKHLCTRQKGREKARGAAWEGTDRAGCGVSFLTRHTLPSEWWIWVGGGGCYRCLLTCSPGWRASRFAGCERAWSVRVLGGAEPWMGRWQVRGLRTDSVCWCTGVGRCVRLAGGLEYWWWSDILAGLFVQADGQCCMEVNSCAPGVQTGVQAMYAGSGIRRRAAPAAPGTRRSASLLSPWRAPG